MQSPGGESEREHEFQIAQEAEALREKARSFAHQPIKEYARVENSNMQESFDRNTDLYAKNTVMRYTANWASKMEERMAAGEKLEDIAAETSSEAFDEELKSFMYVYAVDLLAQSWEHGEELRQWHNLET